MAKKYYLIYDRKIALKKGLNKAYIKYTTNSRDAKIFISNDPKSYIVKKIGKREFIKFSQNNF